LFSQPFALELLEIFLCMAWNLDRSPGGDEVFGYVLPFATSARR
jgi:hypothetical protein